MTAEAAADARTRGLPPPDPVSRPETSPRRTRRRRLVAYGAVSLAVVALLAPLWSGYLGPGAAAYVSAWRPWRTHLELVHGRTVSRTWPQRLTLEAEYRDPWPGQARTPGRQIDFMTLERLRPWLPWIVTAHGTGP